MDAEDVTIFAKFLERSLVKREHWYYRTITPIEVYSSDDIAELPQSVPSDIVKNDALNEYRFAFDRRKDTLSAIHLSLECCRQNVYPPVEILLYITKAFNDFLKSDKNLDEAFKLTAKRSKKKEQTDRKHAQLFTRIDRNRFFFKISVEDAIWMEERRLEENGKSMKDSTLKRIFTTAQAVKRKQIISMLKHIVYCEAIPYARKVLKKIYCSNILKMLETISARK